MDTPTATQVRSWAPPNFQWSTYGFPVPTGSDPDPLDVRVGWAAGTLYGVTGRTMASITNPEETAIAQKVITAFVITEVLGGGPAALAVLEQPWLKSMTAGSYSEQRFSPAELAGGSVSAPPYPPALWALLWAIMTQEKRDDWMFRLTGQRAAAGTFVNVDWGGPGDHHHGDGLMFGPGVTHSWPWN